MPLPDDVTTFTLTFGPYTDAAGAPAFVGKTAKVRPLTRLTHVETGAQILATPLTVTIDEDGTGTLGPLPHTDSDVLAGEGFLTGFLYDLQWQVASTQPSPGNKKFLAPQVLGDTIDFDLLTQSTVVNGIVLPVATGPAGAAGIADDASVAALVPGPGATKTALDAGYEAKISRSGATTGNLPTLQANGTLAFAAPAPTYTDEQARDALGAAITAGPGLTKAVDDSADTITVGLVGWIGPASGDTTGATDKATINAALTARRYVRGTPGETYLINGTLIIPSDTTLDMRGCTVRMVTGSNVSMLRNASLATFSHTGAVNLTAGSPTVTYAAGNGLAATTVGQTLAISHDFSGTSAKLVGTVLAHNTGTRSITLDVNAVTTAVAAVSGTTAYNRDRNIKVIGGVWDRQDNGGGTSSNSQCMVLRFVDGFTLSDLTLLSTSANGLYAILASAVSAGIIERITYGLNPASQKWTGTVGYQRDGVHIDGPATNLIIRDMFGSPGDDMVALTPMDWQAIGEDSAGDITDVTIENIHPVGAGANAVKVLGAPTLTVRRIRIRNIYGSCSGVGGAVWIGNDSRQTQTTGGTIDGVSVENLSTRPANGSPLVLLNGTGMKSISLRDLHYDNTSGTVPIIHVFPPSGGTYFTPTGTATMDRLTVSGLIVRGSGGSQKALTVSSNLTLDELVLRDWQPTTAVRTTDIQGTVRRLRVSDALAVPLAKPSVTGRVYPATDLNSGADVFQVFTQDTLYLALPKFATEQITIDQLYISTNVVGSAGAVSRAGIYQVTTLDPYAVVLGSAYATLLLDAGTLAVDGSTGTKTWTLGTPLVIPVGTWYSFGLVDQVAAAASHRLRSVLGQGQSPWGASAAISTAAQIVTQTGVTGALPATFTPGAFSLLNAGSDNGIGFRRSA